VRAGSESVLESETPFLAWCVVGPCSCSASGRAAVEAEVAGSWRGGEWGVGTTARLAALDVEAALEVALLRLDEGGLLVDCARKTAEVRAVRARALGAIQVVGPSQVITRALRKDGHDQRQQVRAREGAADDLDRDLQCRPEDAEAGEVHAAAVAVWAAAACGLLHLVHLFGPEALRAKARVAAQGAVVRRVRAQTAAQWERVLALRDRASAIALVLRRRLCLDHHSHRFERRWK